MTVRIPKSHKEGVTSSFISLIQEKQKFLLHDTICQITLFVSIHNKIEKLFLQ